MKTYRFKIYGHNYETKVVRREEDEMVISVNGQEYKAYLEPDKRIKSVRATPKLDRPIAVPDSGPQKTAKPTEAKGAGVVKAPLPGLIMKLLVKQGDTVKEGDTLCIMEAMKMENKIASNISGSVSTIHIKEGDSVLEGQELFTIAKN